MTPNLILLNVCSLALIAMLALFARHNKRVGWVKTRSTFVEDLRQLQQDWAEQDELAGLKAPAYTPAGQSAFTVQLASLHTSLKEAAPLGASPEAAVEAEELVAK